MPIPKLIYNFRQWRPNETKREIIVYLKYHHLNQTITVLQKDLFKAQLHPDNHYFYTLRVNQFPSNTKRWASRFLRLIKCPRTHHTWTITVNRTKEKKKLAPNFDPELDVDPFTQKKWSKDRLFSPHSFVLPNYVVDSKSFIKMILKIGEAEFQDPIDKAPYTQTQREKILKQIDHIFGVSKHDFYFCFEPISFSFEELIHLAVDENGQYSNAAKRELAFVINDLENPALPCIDAAFDQIEKKIEERSLKVLTDPQFKKKMQKHLSDLKRSFLDPNCFKLFPHFHPMDLSIVINDKINFQFSLDVNSLMYLAIYKHFATSAKKYLIEMAAQDAFNALKIIYIQNTRLKILEHTLFFEELEKEYQGWMRMKKFEALSGIPLAPKKFQLD